MFLHSRWAAEQSRNMTGQVINFRTAVTTKQMASVMAHGTEIFTLFSSWSRIQSRNWLWFWIWSSFRLLDGWAAVMKTLIIPVVLLNALFLTSHLRVVRQHQTLSLLYLRIRIQVDHQGLIWIWIQIKGVWVSCPVCVPVLGVRMEQDVWLIRGRVRLKAWVWFPCWEGTGTKRFSPKGRGWVQLVNLTWVCRIRVSDLMHVWVIWTDFNLWEEDGTKSDQYQHEEDPERGPGLESSYRFRRIKMWGISAGLDCCFTRQSH